MQVISVVNFKGGSTAAHLAQYLVLRGYRVLAIDLDPQASLSALHGVQPEFDVGENETLYGAIRYDDSRRPLSDIVRKTYFVNLSLIPGNLELMEFEHETPQALMTDRHVVSMFSTRRGSALASVADQYAVVVIDWPAPTRIFDDVGDVRRDRRVGDSSSTNARRHVDAPVLDHDVRPTRCRRQGRWQYGYDGMRYLVTRYEPGDGPRNQMVSFMRSMLGEHVLNFAMLKSTATAEAGIAKQTLYEVSRDQFIRSTFWANMTLTGADLTSHRRAPTF